ncbi:MAG: rRNA pseudouridine synthase [Acidobacteria bacterium]|nr:rRNA pseudouridine synthase [Acidobacteriota bacterium]
MQERLQKLISRAGVASRRHAEQLIVSGQVTVNGHVVTELGSKADPETDHIKVGGKLLRFSQARIYLVLHKPAGCVATMNDPEGRQSLRDFLHGVPGRVFPAGRLDFHTEGLLLLTNDGELVNRLLKVSGHLQQVYWIKVKGPLSEGVLRQVQHAVGARLVPLKSRAGAPNPWYEATVTEAKSDALRQNLAQLGHHVEKLRRVKLADLELGAVEAGKYRMLNEGEVFGLLRSVARAVARPTPAPVAPAPYQGREFQKPRRPAGRPMRPGQRGVRPGGARPATPPQFPKKRWSRPGATPTGPTTGRGVSPGSARPGAPRPFSGKQSGKPWSKPTGNKPKWKTGGKGEQGRSGKPANHKRTDRG